MASTKKLTKSEQDEFRRKLKQAVVEKDVEDAYHDIISLAYKKSNKADKWDFIWTSPYGTDGYFTEDVSGQLFAEQYQQQSPDLYKNFTVLRLLLETKLQEDFLKRPVQCQTLIQAIYYLKKFEKDGKALPNVVLIGDRNECFVVAGSSLYKYLRENVDWTIAPSSAGTPEANRNLLIKMINDNGITPWVFSVESKDVDFNQVIELINQYAHESKLIKLKVTEHDIRVTFEDFYNCVIKPLAKNYDPVTVVSAFIQSLTSKDCYLVPGEHNKLHLASGDQIFIDGMAYISFFARYDKDYNPQEKRQFTSIADRLIEETKRRFHGDFWTPSTWADKAQQVLEEHLGEDYRDKFIVWDNSCGSKNLTRDNRYGELYLSTLHQEELEMSKGYNPEAKATFQMDFLNDDIDISPKTDPKDLKKMPPALLQALKDNKKPFFFLGNPPYGTANNMGAKGTSKENIAKTRMNEIMQNEGAGAASQQLFAQFIWRIMKLKIDFNLDRVVIGFFINPLFFSSSTYWSKFRERLFTDFGFKYGFIFPASQFADVSSTWGVSFVILDSDCVSSSIWDESKEHHWDFDALTINKNNVITKFGTKKFYQWSKDKSLSEWIREPIKTIKTEFAGWECAQLASGLRCSTAKAKPSGSLCYGSIGYMVNVANNVYKSPTDTWIASSSPYMGHGLNICKENFERCVVNFAVRRLVTNNWLVNKDEYHVPNTKANGYDTFVSDSAVLSIFNSASNQTSVKDLESTGKSYTFKNEWFPWDPKKIEALANKNNNSEIYNDVVTDKPRFMFNWLQKRKLSDEAQAVLDTAWELVKLTFAFRVAYNNAYVKGELLSLHLNRWDAGWYQINMLIKSLKYTEKTPELKAFKTAYKTLENKLRKQIETYGFLKDTFGHFTAHPEKPSADKNNLGIV